MIGTRQSGTQALLPLKATKVAGGDVLSERESFPSESMRCKRQLTAFTESALFYY